MSKNRSAEKHWNYGNERTEEHKKNISAGTKAAMDNPELKKHLSNEAKKRFENKTTEQIIQENIKRSNTLKEFYKTENGIKSTRLKSKKMSGKNNPFYGKKHKQLKCPHCSKIGANGAMQRWHFNNCKELTKC